MLIFIILEKSGVTQSNLIKKSGFMRRRSNGFKRRTNYIMSGKKRTSGFRRTNCIIIISEAQMEKILIHKEKYKT
jgi:hypothetical protein